MRRAALFMLLIIMLWGLTGCAALDGMLQSDAKPDLRLLQRPVYTEQPPVQEAVAESGALRLDLWLDASQVMGGVNPSVESMYPHSSRKYREGGFHYRYENTAGMYESVLRCMLSAVEGCRVRLLRCGNERLPDSYLVEQKLADSAAAADTLRSIRRDMLTYAIDPMPSIFTGFSGVNMDGSFYSLGTPHLNQMDVLPSALLENPALASRMDSALDAQIRAIENRSDDTLLAVGDDSDYPLLYALNNLDLNRLSVITCDPASIRRLTAVDSSGAPAALVEELLYERGVFDAGLSAGLYAFTLDYMGQMASFAAADLSEPLLWGRLDYSNFTKQTEGILVMPRTLLTLVIGRADQVQTFTDAFEKQLDVSAVLREQRGPDAGQLTYTFGGQTIVQQPFSFDYDYTFFSRAEISCLTQYTQDASLAADGAEVSSEGTLRTVTLAPADGVQPDRTFTLSLPLSQQPDGMLTDLSRLGDVSVTVQNALLLADTLPNHPSTVLPSNTQAITLRDRIYVFSQQQPESPVHCSGVLSENGVLQLQLAVDGSALVPGYYRLLVSADLPGESMEWQTPDWVARRSVSITNEQISAWENFSQLLARYERLRENPSRPFQHAWGDASNTTYYDTPVPDFPPVMLAPGLSALVAQLQDAAHLDDTPFVRFVFDLFVTNESI